LIVISVLVVSLCIVFFVFFFFQAEDGIRDFHVTGVQTCAPPIFSPQYTAEECMSLMLDKRIRPLPVYENQKLIGIVSIGDVVKAVIDGKDWEITELANYITGSR